MQMQATEKLYSAVMVSGQRQEFDSPLSVDKIKELFESYGINHLIDNAVPNEISPGVLEFIPERGVNGTK